MKIFSGSSNKPLAEKIAQALDLTLSPLEIFIFPDKERRVRTEKPVLGEHCVIVQSTATPADQNYVELFFIVDAMKRSGAKRVTAVVPYLGYQRQDHIFRDGEAVSLEVMVKTLEATGLDDIIVFDLHSIKIPEVFKIAVTHLSAIPLFAARIKENGWADKETVLVTPDMGGIRRIKIISELLENMPYASIEKNRDLATGLVEAASMEGSTVKDKKVVIMDDMISSGGTIIKAAELLKQQGAKEIHVYATHGVFSADAPARLQASLVDKVFVSDSVYVSPHKRFDKLEIISLAETTAEQLSSK